MAVDWVIPYKAGGDELRYSLRSLDKFGPEVGTLWIVGDNPDWLTGHRHIPGNSWGTKQQNVPRNVLAACEHPDMPAQAMVSNDDFFILDPVDSIPVAYRGSLREHLDGLRNRTGWWSQSLEATLDYLAGIGFDDPLSYELHRPLLMDTEAMGKALTDMLAAGDENPPQWRTVYGNVAGIGGRQARDGKIYGSRIPSGIGILSTAPTAFHRAQVTRLLAQSLPEPSRWEVA